MDSFIILLNLSSSWRGC